MKKKFLFIIFLNIFFLSAVQANCQSSVLNASRLVRLEAFASADNIPNDTVNITLFAEQQGLDSNALNEWLRIRVEKTLNVLKSNKAIAIDVGSFGINPVEDRDGKFTNWRGRAELILKSKDFKTAIKLANEVSSSMNIASIAYSLSEKAQDEKEKELISQAIEKFNIKASEITRSFRYQKYILHDINVNFDNFSRPRNSMMLYAAPATANKISNDDFSLPAGTVKLTVRVDGKIQMQN